MRSKLNPRIILLSATLALSTTHVASAQDLDDPPWDFVTDLQSAVVLNAKTDASVNAAIEASAKAAHGEIRQIEFDKRKDPGFIVADNQPDRASVANRAQGFADVEDEDDVKELVIVHGGDSDRTVAFVARTPKTTIIDLGQPLPCVDADGRFDRTGECVGGAETLPSNYAVVTFEVQDPAYLAGVLAASASRNDRLGIIGGMPDCDECNRYIQGFILGAQSVEPEIAIELAFLADENEALAFGDAGTAKTFAKAFIDVYQPDVVLPVANDASIGIIEAADEAGVLVVGADVDVAARHPELASSVLASITRDVGKAVRHSIYEFSTGQLPRVFEATLDGGYVGLTDDWETRTLPVGVTDLYNDALDGLLRGTIDACPSSCGEPYGPDGSGVPGTSGDATATELGPQASEAPAD